MIIYVCVLHVQMCLIRAQMINESIEIFAHKITFAHHVKQEEAYIYNNIFYLYIYVCIYIYQYIDEFE
jgi:hypothetical protein